MSKSKKVLNYTVMVCAIIAAIIFFINQEWNTFLWAIIALAWMVNSHLYEDSYCHYKESLDKLTDDYFKTLIMHGKEVKELKGQLPTTEVVGLP